MGWRDATGWLVAFAVLVVVAYSAVDSGDESNTGVGGSTQQATSGGERTARVVRVVDGDTIVVRADGRDERVRYIGIDTPESVKPDTQPECFGKQAAEANRRLVEGEEVRLVPDREPFDRFDRALAYVFVDDTFVNGDLVENGYATTIEIEPNTSRAVELNTLERVAKRTNKGLWGACDR